jgi:hypothetical protein
MTQAPKARPTAQPAQHRQAQGTQRRGHSERRALTGSTRQRAAAAAGLAQTATIRSLARRASVTRATRASAQAAGPCRGGPARTSAARQAR